MLTVCGAGEREERCKQDPRFCGWLRGAVNRDRTRAKNVSGEACAGRVGGRHWWDVRVGGGQSARST